MLGKARNDAAREALWRKEFEVGRIAGAYWAFMTDAYIEEKFARRIFGEVHMLSHVLGRTTHHTATRASELAARVDQLEAQALRRSQSHGAALAARDATIATLRAEQEVRDPSAFSRQDHTVPQARPAGSQAHLLQKKERALIAARERARSAETEARVLREKVASLQILMERRSSQPDGQCPGAQAFAETVQSDVKRRILYIGGRTGGVEHLRRVAIQARAELVHHHGGEEQALGRIDGLVENCDAVFCPIDCVSHSACLKAKALCKRMQKPFVPLRSSGIASFQRALSSLTGAAGTAN